jgi:thiol:disulfide interchange protein/DsbC/DsbD-like thiol-disulfide interchange protein
MMHRLITLLVCFFASFDVGSAQVASVRVKVASEARLVSEVSAIAPGKSFTVALQLVHPAEWHSYYKNSGGVELPPTIEWTLPDGLTAGPIQWPVPEVKDGYFGKSFIYAGAPVFLTDIRVSAGVKAGDSVDLLASAKWQICKDSCISEEQVLKLVLPVRAELEMDPAHSALFEKARADQARGVPGLVVSAQPVGDEVQIRISPAESVKGTPSDFIPNEAFLQPASAGGDIRRDGDGWVVTLRRIKMDFLDKAVPQGSSVSGILVGVPPLEIPETLIASAPPKSLPFFKYLPILGGMMLGGLILNLMPCVFPVIGLKIMGFVQQAGADRKKIALHGVMFAGGVLVSFGVLSGVLFIARLTSGVSKGWGYQLQEPWVVLTLMLLMFVLALNMFGLFELGTSATSVGGSLQSKQGLGGAFFSGVLATIVATPCSAPFLGAAIGVAVGLPAVQFFAAFVAMAMGLSLPYLVLSIFPKLLDFLPRPGGWMESFKQAMSFFLFATAGYLFWVYAGQIGLENMLGPLFGMTSIAVAAWIYGRWNLPHRPRSVRWVALALTVLFAGGGFWLVRPPEKSALIWEPWSQERVDEVLGSGSPVFIDFTAQWCATCQVNKRTAYSKEVIALMKERGVVAFKADKTNPDPLIESKLAELGRTAIPVNVLITPGQEPIITPEILTAGYLKALFGAISFD